MHGAGPQISAEMLRFHVPIRFVRGRRVTSPAGAHARPPHARRGQRVAVRRSRAPGRRPARRRDRPRGDSGARARARRRAPAEQPTRRGRTRSTRDRSRWSRRSRGPAQRERRRGGGCPRDRPGRGAAAVRHRRPRPPARRSGRSVDRSGSRPTACSRTAISRAGSSRSCGLRSRRREWACAPRSARRR